MTPMTGPVFAENSAVNLGEWLGAEMLKWPASRIKSLKLCKPK
jgi:hypothetical protein